MHENLEIIMPQVDDVEATVDMLMTPFSEHLDEPDVSAFYDWFVIGGRFAGHKLVAGLDPDKLEAFYTALTERQITVSSLQCGKQEIYPSSQVPEVDALWVSLFPAYAGRACPLFSHSNNQYGNNCLYGDVIRLQDLPAEVSCTRVLIAGYRPLEDELSPRFMLSDSVWNGLNNENTLWDGTIEQALDLYTEDMRYYLPEYKKKNTPTGDWITVTVDYHS